MTDFCWAFVHDDDAADVPMLSMAPTVTTSTKTPVVGAPATALHFAVMIGDAHLVRKLLENQTQASAVVSSLTASRRGVLSDNQTLPRFHPHIDGDEPRTTGAHPSSPPPLSASSVRVLEPMCGGYTALHLTAVTNEVEYCRAIRNHLRTANVVAAFIDRPAGRLKKTPLMYVAGAVSGHHRRNHSCVPLLVAHGVSLVATDTKGRTALDHAHDAERRIQALGDNDDPNIQALRSNAPRSILLLFPPLQRPLPKAVPVSVPGETLHVSSLRRVQSGSKSPAHKRVNNLEAPPDMRVPPPPPSSS